MPGQIDSIFFDYGGTLFDYYPSNTEIWASIANRLGVPIEPDDPRIREGMRTQSRELDKIDKEFHELTEDELHQLNRFVLTAMGVTLERSHEIVTAEFIAREQGKMFQIYPDAIILSVEVGVWKPDKRIFELALREIGTKNPRRAMHVGDSLKADVRGAGNAGLIPVLFDPLDLHFSENTIKIKALSEVLQYL